MSEKRPIPIYSTSGDWAALLIGRTLYSVRGEWIGWLEGKDVYTRDGEYAGYLSNDQRVLRKRVKEHPPLRTPPSPLPPARIRPPASVPLPPLFAETRWEIVDVFEEEPEIFEFVSELKPDWEG